MGLRDDIAAIKANAEASNEQALKNAAEAAAKRDQEQKASAIAAILSLLSDDSVKVIVTAHAPKGSKPIATIGIHLKEVALMKSHAPGTLVAGEKLKLRFDANAIVASHLFEEHAVQARIAELENQGVLVKERFDPKSDILLITFDYTNA